MGNRASRPDTAHFHDLRWISLLRGGHRYVDILCARGLCNAIARRLVGVAAAVGAREGLRVWKRRVILQRVRYTDPCEPQQQIEVERLVQRISESVGRCERVLQAAAAGSVATVATGYVTHLLVSRKHLPLLTPSSDHPYASLLLIACVPRPVHEELFTAQCSTLPPYRLKWMTRLREAWADRHRRRLLTAAVAGLATGAVSCVVVSPFPYSVCTAALCIALVGAHQGDLDAWRLPPVLEPHSQRWRDWLWGGGASLQGLVTWQERSVALKASIGLAQGRLEAYFQGTLEPYHYAEETTAAMAVRLADYGATIAGTVAPYLERWKTALQALSALPRIRIVAPMMLGGIALRTEAYEAFANLMTLLGSDNLADCRVSVKQLLIGLYYVLVYRRGERGNNPTLSVVEHLQENDPGVIEEHAPDHLLDVLAHYAPLAKFVYQEVPAEVQRLTGGAGYKLIEYVEGEGTRHPPFCIVVQEQRKEAVLVIRGTKVLADVLVDACALPAVFTVPGCTPFSVHIGMLRSAVWLWLKLWLPLLRLKEKGFTLKVVGHSLGAGIAVMLAVMIRQYGLEPDLPVHAFAMPACGDQSFAQHCEDFVLAAICGDDLVPRVSLRSLRNLLTAVCDPVLQSFSERDFSTDTSAVICRLMWTAWAPKVRPKLSLTKGATRKIDFFEDDDRLCFIEALSRAAPQVRAPFVDALIRMGGAAQVHVHSELGTSHTLYVSRTETSTELVAKAAVATGIPHETVQLWRLGGHPKEESSATLIVTSPQHTVEGVLYPTPTPLILPVAYVYVRRVRPPALSDDSALSLLRLKFSNPGEPSREIGSLALDLSIATVAQVAAAVACAADRMDPRSVELWCEAKGGREMSLGVTSRTLASLGLRSGSVVVGRDVWGARLGGRAAPMDQKGAEHLPAFLPPGQLVHFYWSCGLGRAALVHPWSKVFERIEVSSNMGEHHRMDSMLRAIRSVHHARQPHHPPPEWVPFSSASTCTCCHAPFNWDSTSGSAAEQLRSRYHCHSCGQVVCSECRAKQLPLPLYGIPLPAPVCDTCFFRMPSFATRPM